MKSDDELIAQIISLFVVDSKGDRFTELASNKKRYDDFLWELLNDPRNLRSGIVTDVSKGPYGSDEILKMLLQMGAKPDVFVLSLSDSMDRRRMALSDALREVIGYQIGSIVYSVGTNLGFYEGHEGWKFILDAGQQ
ncbi:MAG: hypothetical protein JNL64_08560 [Blastocatellia bacterium]|nr:hypothetical protein [Blastocatellia bacterium]